MIHSRVSKCIRYVYVVIVCIYTYESQARINRDRLSHGNINNLYIFQFQFEVFPLFLFFFVFLLRIFSILFRRSRNCIVLVRRGMTEEDCENICLKLTEIDEFLMDRPMFKSRELVCLLSLHQVTLLYIQIGLHTFGFTTRTFQKGLLQILCVLQFESIFFYLFCRYFCIPYIPIQFWLDR